jgi:hypothetical protein
MAMAFLPAEVVLAQVGGAAEGFDFAGGADAEGAGGGPADVVEDAAPVEGVVGAEFVPDDRCRAGDVEARAQAEGRLFEEALVDRGAGEPGSDRASLSRVRTSES